MPATAEDLDLIRNPDRIFDALLEFRAIPEQQKAFLRRARERMEARTMGPVLFARVLEIAFEYGLFSVDMRPYVLEPPKLKSG